MAAKPPNPALETYLDELRQRFDGAAQGYTETYVRETFDQFDVDNGGTIDPDEFRLLCKRISPTMTEADIAEALEVIDEDGDGEITSGEPVADLSVLACRVCLAKQTRAPTF